MAVKETPFNRFKSRLVCLVPARVWTGEVACTTRGKITDESWQIVMIMHFIKTCYICSFPCLPPHCTSSFALTKAFSVEPIWRGQSTASTHRLVGPPKGWQIFRFKKLSVSGFFTAFATMTQLLSCVWMSTLMGKHTKQEGKLTDRFQTHSMMPVG